MERLDLDAHDRVARGIEPRLGPYAAKTNVIMTDESIVTVGAHMFRFCGLVSKAFVRTLNINPFFWESHGLERHAAISILKKNPSVLKYWMELYFSYIATGTNIMVEFLPSTKYEVVLCEQVARAMELFSIAHEYGHHHLNHGKQIADNSFHEEFEADQFPLRVCYEVERKPVIMPNPYLSSGAGGVILLSALHTLRRLTAIIERNTKKMRDTHPHVATRIERYDAVSCTQAGRI